MLAQAAQTSIWIQYIPMISASFAAIALLLNVIQSRRNNLQARASLIAGSLKDFAGDDEMQKAFYLIEYSEFVYDDITFHKSELERQIDKLLRHFANIALSWQSGLLSHRDIVPLKYYVLRVLRDAEVQKYLNFVEHWSTEQKLGEHPYGVLVRMGKTMSAA